MTEANKSKISFGFSKIKKKAPIIDKLRSEKNENKSGGVQYIRSIEDNTIRLSNGEAAIPKEKEPLVIPLKRKHFKPGDELNDVKEDSKTFNDTTLLVPLTSNAPVGEKEPTLDDYEDIPVQDFGMAMLRGMGWHGQGIGKKPKIVLTSEPQLRPKGLGLGADKKNQTEDDDKEEMAEIKKGCYVRVTRGSNKGCYGIVQGICDDSGRIFVKLSTKSDKDVASISENALKNISKAEYNKNHKVINIKKYTEFKEKEKN